MSTTLAQPTATKVAGSTKAPSKASPRHTGADLERLASEAELLGGLVEWCITAQAVMEGVYQAVEISPALKAAFVERDVRYSPPDLVSYRVDESLAALLQRQCSLIRQMAGSAA